MAEVGDRRVTRADEAGVTMAMGTDTLRSPRGSWGQNAYEIEPMVDRGMPPRDALPATTRYTARALGADDRPGPLDAGKLVDLIAVDGDREQDVRVPQDLGRVPVVMKGGQIVGDRRTDAEREASAR